MNKKWAEFPILGCLYIEKVLIRFDVPLLFVCNTSTLGLKYLVLCINEETNEFLLAECNNEILLQLLREKKQSIDGVFKIAEKLFLANRKNSSCQSINIKDVTDEMLPDKDTFFTIKNKSIDEYIEQLENKISTNEILHEYKKYKIDAIQEKKYGRALSKKILSNIKNVRILYMNHIDQNHKNVSQNKDIFDVVVNQCKIRYAEYKQTKIELLDISNEAFRNYDRLIFITDNKVYASNFCN